HSLPVPPRHHAPLPAARPGCRPLPVPAGRPQRPRGPRGLCRTPLPCSLSSPADAAREDRIFLSFPSRSLLDKPEGYGIHAIPTVRRGWSVRKDVTQMGVAPSAEDLVTGHAERTVGL